jgi:hypothetical protein
MMAVMRDLDAIDEQLRDLRAEPRDRPALLTRALGTDRSRDRLEELLADLAGGAPAPKAGQAGHTPRAVPVMAAPAMAVPVVAAAATPAAEYDYEPDTDESEPPEAAELEADPSDDTLADRPSVQAGDYEPAHSLDAEPSEPPPPAPDERSRFAAMFDYTNPPPARQSVLSAPEPAGAFVEPAEPESPFDPPAHARSTYQEPADEETTARRSVPPPPEPAVADDDADIEEADFELLVDDEDIIEIDDDEMIIDDD